MSTSQNQLRYEKSPYLLQHKDNPVHWYAWGDEAFSAAREQNKPIFLSIGYSTCHWCHVMEHESFEKEEVAEILNRHFISIKLDREERPDIDEIYMAAVQAMRQRGGWPLSVFLTPELKPFYAGTYFPKAHFMQLLHHLAQLWQKEQGQIQESAESITHFLREQKSQSLSPIALSPSVLIEFYQNSLLNYDPRWGGFGSAPKFPHAMQISLLMRVYQKTGEARALEMVQHSLDQMARGGIYDHLGFGFARYSTDEKWLVPHFEKMLYDNALLVVSYLEAYQLTKEPSFRQVASECLDYVLRVMTHPEGGFYSAEDADSDGEEGKFYVWTQAELQQILSVEEFSELAKVYGVSAEGNFEHHRNIFNLQPGFDASVKDSPLIKSAFQKLFELREKRIHPHLDDKILTSWNGLMIRAMALGYQVLKDERYLKAAHRAADFIRAHLDTPQGLLARYRDGESRYAARLEDYAYLVEALIELYQCDFDPEILGWAWRLQEHQEQKFWDEVSGAYFFTDGKDESVLLRSQEGMDGALPNANGVSALNLLKFSALLAKPELKTKAEKIFQRYSKLIVEYPQAFSQMLLAYDFYSAEIQEIVIMRGKTGDEDLFLSQLRERFHSHHVVASGKEGDSFPALLEKRKTESNITTYYICRHQSCEKPTTSAAVALSLIV